MHNITQLGSYYALNILFHRHRSRHIERSRTNSSLPGLQPGWCYPFPFLSISEAKTQVQQPKTRFIAYHYASLCIITHHYSIHYSLLLIITQIALLFITHHYTYLRWVKILLRWLKIWCHKTLHTPSRPLRIKINRGACPPRRVLCVMMSKKEIYE